MSARQHQAEKDKKKQEQDKLQLILNRLLKEEDNKYCADCEAKGPRWATWNLGVFLCIRCAGIHRNLGVHVSRVKSVNLDTWTAEQVQHMRVIGNSVGKAVYEASLPDHFRRPQTDSALEAFIRAKYEHKRYLMKDYVPAKIDVRDLLTSDEFLRPHGVGGSSTSPSTTDSGSKTKKTTTTSSMNLEPKAAPVQSKRDSAGSTGKERVRRRSSNSNSQQSQSQQHPKSDGKQQTDAHSASVATALNDLVDLDVGGGGGAHGWHTASTPNLAGNGGGGGLDDLLGLNVGATSQQNPTQVQHQQAANGSAPPNSSSNGLSELSQDLLFGGGGGTGTTVDAGGSKKSKNDIMALFGGGGGQQQAQAPTMMGGIGAGGFNMAPQPHSQMPFAGMPNQMMNMGMGVAAAPQQQHQQQPASNWMMGGVDPNNAFGALQQAPPMMMMDPNQQNPGGYVATPFGYVPVAQTQQQQQPMMGGVPGASFGHHMPGGGGMGPPTMGGGGGGGGTNTGANLHLQSIQQQLASLQIKRTPQQQPPTTVTSPQQDTLATNLWH